MKASLPCLKQEENEAEDELNNLKRRKRRSGMYGRYARCFDSIMCRVLA